MSEDFEAFSERKLAELQYEMSVIENALVEFRALRATQQQAAASVPNINEGDQ